MPSDKPKFTLRVDKDTLGKLRYIADNNFRTINKELEMVIMTYIKDFERNHGVIEKFENKLISDDKDLLSKFHENIKKK